MEAISELDLGEGAAGLSLRTRELWKVGAAIACPQAGSLRGPEVFFMDIAGLIKHIGKGKGGVIPENPLLLGVNLNGAPHVHLVMQGKFKGENNAKYHLVTVASECMSGIDTRCWRN